MNTLLGHLQAAHSYGDLKCPHCKKFSDVVWDTEYGDPLAGEAQANCPHCGESIQFETEINVTYTPYIIQGQ